MGINRSKVLSALALLNGLMLSACSQAMDSSSDSTEQLQELLVSSSAPATVKQAKGLAVIVQFSDYKLAASSADIAAMLNQPSGFRLWGNRESVNEYYAKQSNGHLALNSQVITVSLNRPASYYTTTATFDAGQELTKDVIAAINRAFPAGFSGLTKAPGEDRLWSFMLLFSTDPGGGVSFGLSDPNLTIKNDGVPLPVRATLHVAYPPGTQPRAGVVCHELGHLLFGWTDYYVVHPDASNIGHYCNMGSGGDEAGAMPINPALRYQQRWIDTVVELSTAVTRSYTVTANSRSQVFKYTNPKNPQEYYLIEALIHGGEYVAIDGDNLPTDEGLAIWYVDEGFSSIPTQPRIKLVQADGRDDMNDPNQSHQVLRGDLTDLFDNISNSFSATSHGAFGWKDGSQPGLVIRQISAPGPTMTFTVESQTLPVRATLALTSDWDQGYCAQVGVSNTGSSSLPSWAVKVDIAQSVLFTTWNGRFAAVGPINTVTPFDYNSVLAPGSSTGFGFCANKVSGRPWMPRIVD